jgi:hypothetical protein
MLAVFALALLSYRGIRESANPYRPSDGFRLAAAGVDRAAAGTAHIVVLGEPAVVFYLRQLGRTTWHIDRPTDASRYVRPGERFFLVGGIYSRRVRGPRSLATWMEAHPGAADTVGRVGVTRVSDVRLLDDFGPRSAGSFHRHPGADYDLEIYSVTWPAQ